MSEKEKLEELKKYLYKNKISSSKFARDVGITYSSLCRYFNGSRKPSLIFKKFVKILTKGKIDFDEDS